MTSLSLIPGAGTEWLANPRAEIVMPSAPKRDASRAGNDLPEYVTREEVQRATDNATPMGALIGFLWATGARISEALAVRPCDLDVQRSMVRLPTLKGRRKDGSGRKTSPHRIVPVPAPYLARVFGVIIAGRTEHEDPIWPIGRQWAWRAIATHLQAAGVEAGRAKPHALRHGHAVHAVLNNVALNLIQRQLGHRSIANTAIYLRVTGQDLAREYSRFLW